ncbi:PREDICTED: IQ domain-containing protein E isoform X3 [Poecilia mexicana]|uniref:IQ domain-containing protein E isoform X3 n=1 Tax=Poecilia mexicana TaxID=48701 RepID=UPI00072DAED8|nr:PREDICTED: IQ domain-containing protein E isoform X3 [Poecilia mexicana]
MFSATHKMSLEESDVPTDEDCEDLVEEGFTLPSHISSKRTSRKKSTGRPSPSPRSPYLSSLNMNSRRAAVAAWRLPRPSLGDTRGNTSREHRSAHLTSLSNGHDVSYMVSLESADSPQLLKQKSSLKKHLSASNGFAIGAGDCQDKDSMYDEIIRLKKTLQAQKSDNQQMKVKLRRLEEDGAKREKQIEELLDPTKGSEYIRSLVDKRKEGSVIVSGLKQRILKLEQQCREKENSLSKLQSELRTTNLDELKMTVETYLKEVILVLIQRLRILLDAAEKSSSRADSKCSQRQQKALSSTVHRLTENVKHLQQENAALREELNTDDPAAGIKGYREWSRQRLLRRLLEVERRLESSRRHSRRHTQSVKSRATFNEEAQTVSAEVPGFPLATDAVVSMGTVAEQKREVSALRERLGQLEEERVELQERLSSKSDEVKQLRKERDELAEEAERLKAKHKEQLDRVEQQHRQELEQLLTRIQTLEDRSKLIQAEECSPSSTVMEHPEAQCRKGQEEEEERPAGYQEEEEREEALSVDAEVTNKEKAALIIQTNWRQHRQRDIVILQSVIRSHLFRHSWLKDFLKNTEKKSEVSLNSKTSGGGLDVAALTLIQSAFRGHLARCSIAIKSSGFAVPSPAENCPPALVPGRAGLTDSPRSKGSASLSKNAEKEEDNHPVSSRQQAQAQQELLFSAEVDADAVVESDDSDEIVVSPSRPLRNREVLMR